MRKSRKIISMLLVVAFILSSSIVFAEKADNVVDVESTQISREIVESIFPDNETSKQYISSGEEDEFVKTLNLLTRKRLDYHSRGVDKETIDSEIEQIHTKLEELGGKMLNQEEVDKIFYASKNTLSKSKPNVRPDTKRYSFWSRAKTVYTSGKFYDTFQIYASPKSYSYGNMLIVENKELQSITEQTILSDISNSTWISIYALKVIGTALDKAIDYGSLIPFELFWPDGNYTDTATKLEATYVMYTDLNWIYVAYPGGEAYDKIISTGKVTGDYTFITKHIKKKSELKQIPFTFEQTYFGDYTRAAKMYAKGEVYNHYYPINNIKLVNKKTGKTELTTAIRTLSDISDLN